ncbi:hypothetical protein M2263_002643 [Providencia alcalifaciens]|nr:hypothetical protein [Providencia alcalifaciens]
MKKMNDNLIEEIYYFNINRTCEKDIISIGYKNGTQLNVISNEERYLKLIMSKMLWDELSYNQLFFLINKKTPQSQVIRLYIA